MTKFITIFFILIASNVLVGQAELSLEYQIYPTGSIPAINYHHPLSTSADLTFRLGANLFDHKDLGVHDGEEGNGFGGSIGYRKFLTDTRATWFWHVRCDLWFNEVDWFDDPTGPSVSLDPIIGSTSIIVLQPTASVGYAFVIPSKIIISPSISFGYEWNIKTKGEPTGQGAIVLLGLQVGKRF